MMRLVSNQQIVTDGKIDALTRVHDERFKGIEHRINSLERDVEDTGNHNIEELKRAREEAEKKLAPAKADGIWWQRTWVLAVGALVMLVLSSCASVVVAVAVAKVGK